MTKYLVRFVGVLFIVLIAASCSNQIDLNESSKGYYDLSGENKILSFKLLGLEANIRATNAGDSVNGYNMYNSIITLTMPIDTNLSAMVPIIKCSPKARVAPVESKPQNFNVPVEYVVTSENGNESKNLVIIKRYINYQNDILQFSVKGKNGYIDEIRGVITLIVDSSTDVRWLVPDVVVSPTALGYEPQADMYNPIDFTYPVNYYVFSGDQIHQKRYAVSVSTLEMSRNSIFKFTLGGVVADIDQSTHMITASFPFGTDLTNMGANIVYSKGAIITCNKNDNILKVTDFSTPVIYTLVGTDGIAKDYTVVATVN